MTTTNKILCISASFLSLGAFMFCLAAIIKSADAANDASVVFMSLLASLNASVFTVCIMIFFNQKLFIFKSIFENANDAITIIGKNGKYIWQNRANRVLCGFNDAELKENSAEFFINDRKIDTVGELRKISEFSGIFSIASKEQTPKKVWISAFKVENELENSICYVEMRRNVSEFLKLLEQTTREKERLEQKSKSDFLTGVYNRAGFLSKMDEKYQNLHITGCVVFADIDKFKDINDMFGHRSGDEILKSVAKLMDSSLRASDIVCRWGGEEFVLWIDADEQTTHEICEKIRHKIEAARPIGIFTTCSFGIAAVKRDIQEAIKEADEAMYAAKQNGRNSVKVFENNNQNS